MLKQIILSLTIVSVAFAADYAPPPEAISLEDARMAAFYANPENRTVITGKFVDLPDELRAKVVLTCFEPTFIGQRTQVSRAVPIASDGSFRIAFEDAVPLRDVFIRITCDGGFKSRSLGLMVTKDISVACKYLPEKKQLTIAIEGPDEDLNEIVEGFTRYEREKKNALMQRLPTVAKKTENFDAALADINEAKKALDELLRAYAPEKFGWVLQQDLDARYMMALLCTAFENNQSLEGRPEWATVLAFKPYITNSHALTYYSYLGMYLNQMLDGGRYSLSSQELRSLIGRRLKVTDNALKPAGEEFLSLKVKIEQGITVDQTRFKELSELLAEAGLLGLDATSIVEMKIRRYRGKVSDEKLDFMLLQSLPSAPEEALGALQPTAAFVGERWPRQIVAQVMPQLGEQAAKVKAALAKATTLAADGMGTAPQVLPSGAKLYKLPDVSGEELLARIKSMAKGKALVIDFWGPWCMPCMGDLPNSQKAHVALEDAPVEFVYLGCRTSDAPWKEAIARLGLSGTHVLLTSKQNEELMALFKNTGYPSYIFIDKKGELRPGAITRFERMKIEELRRLID